MDKGELEKKQKLEKAMEKLKALSSTRPVSSTKVNIFYLLYLFNNYILLKTFSI